MFEDLQIYLKNLKASYGIQSAFLLATQTTPSAGNTLEGIQQVDTAEEAMALARSFLTSLSEYTIVHERRFRSKLITKIKSKDLNREMINDGYFIW